MGNYKAIEEKLLKNFHNHQFYIDHEIPKELIVKYSDEINWKWLSENQSISKEIKEIVVIEKKLLNNFHNHQFYIDYDIPEELIEKYSDEINWKWLSENQNISAELLDKYSCEVDFDTDEKENKKKRIIHEIRIISNVGHFMDIVFLAVIFIVIAIVYYIIGPTLKHNFDKRLHKLQLKDIESTVSENMDEFQIPSEGWKR